jgi:hypothetical protein
MVEKVTTAGQEIPKPAATAEKPRATSGQPPAGTQEKQPSSQGGGADTTAGGSSVNLDVAAGGAGGKTTEKPTLPPRPEGTISPVEHHMAHGSSMRDPNGHCLACGHEMLEDAWTCPHCEDNPVTWNQKVTKYDDDLRNNGYTDTQIRQKSDIDLGGYKAQGKTSEFQKTLDAIAEKEALGG